MTKKHILLLCFLGCASLMCAQQEASNWYFGKNAGLQFDVSTGNVTAITNGQLVATEGCTSISDTDGNLLFYSNGRSIWNANHLIMPNANETLGTGLKGDDSSTSSGLIVPKPEDENSYYIFTVDEPHHFNSSAYPNQQDGDGVNDGLMYSLVNMNLDGGLGDVDATEKNIQLVTYNPNNQTQVDFKCSEKITAVKADDCSSFWVISHFVNSFYAFKIDTNGVNTTPVISTVGPVVPAEGYRRNALGYIKASPNGENIVVAHHGFATQTAGETGGGVYLFDFDNDTGIISNPLTLMGPEMNDSPYGVEFSAENKKVYATISQGVAGDGPSRVVQWNLESSNIPNSMVTIHSSNTLSAGALQLGLDKKIYRAQAVFSNLNSSGQYLGVINNPEANGTAANYNEAGILVDINGGFQNTSRIGLPPFIQSLFNSEIDIIQNGVSSSELFLCTNDNYTLTAENITGATYNWIKDGIALPETTFELFIDSPGIYEVYVEPNNGDCPIEGEALVSYHDIPVANDTDTLVVCDLSVNSSIDLSVKTAEILGNQNPDEFTVHYYTTQENANTGNNQILGSFNNIESPQEVFVRVDNNSNTNCYDTTSFFVEVYVAPQIILSPDILICDSGSEAEAIDGISSYDLTLLYDSIYGTQDSNLYSVTFHATQNDADTNTNPLATNYTNTTPNSETIFVRIENNINTDCYNTASLNFIVNSSPEANDSVLIQCDEDGIADGLTTFNLNEISDNVTGGVTNTIVNYYLSEAAALQSENEINAAAFNNSTNPQVIYAKVTNIATNCYEIANVTLQASTNSANNTALTTCDYDGIEDGFSTFNLSDANTAILNNLPPQVVLTYYETYTDALLEQNAISSTFANTTPYSQTVYGRVENANDCYGISEIELSVLALPNIETEAERLYCLNYFPQSITLTGGVINNLPNNYYYLWSTGATTQSIEVNQPGTYTVRVTNTNGCFKDRTITVLPSNIATFTDIEITDASNNNSISVFVTGEGTYDYALNTPNGPYQTSSVFENVPAGIHTVYVRDIKNDCGTVDTTVSVIGFPKYFTPNNDGYHDYWQVYGIDSQFQSGSHILIYDRFGKLIKELDPLSIGWDGSFNGKLLPANDYWFYITLEDGRVYKGHFSLVR